MKKLFFSVLLTGSLLSAWNFYGNVELETIYDDNILNLSDNDLQRFDAGDEEKFKIETSDDLIISSKINLSLKHHEFFSHTQILRTILKFNKYSKNDIKDNFYFAFIIRQYLSAKLDIACYYYFYPEIFVNRYDSMMDQSDSYRDFTYAQNKYFSKIRYRFLDNWEISYRFDFAQQYYNKYFTEYDAEKFENSLEIAAELAKWLELKLGYTFIESNSAGEDAYFDPAQIETIKDASYEGNSYKILFDLKKIIKIGQNPLSAKIGFSLDERFFQTDNRGDTYHFKRNDRTLQFNFGLERKLFTAYKLSFDYRWEKRNTESFLTSVERDKNYQANKFSLSLQYNWK